MAIKDKPIEGHVLVVDDEETIRKSVSLSLKKAGYDVEEAEDGAKAARRWISGADLLSDLGGQEK